MMNVLCNLLDLFYDNLLISRIALALIVLISTALALRQFVEKRIKAEKLKAVSKKTYTVLSVILSILTYLYSPDTFVSMMRNAERPVESTLQKGWGPARDLYTMQVPAAQVTLNSITDNNTEIGDERFFVSATRYTGDASQNHWNDRTVVQADEEYVVRIYVDNNAADNLELLATDIRAYVIMQEEANYSFTIASKLYCSNAVPDTIWDTTSFYSDRKFRMAYVPGTLRYYNNAVIDGFILDEDGSNLHLFQQEGIPLGYEELDGKLPSGNQYAGYLTFHIKPIFEI